MNSKNRKYLIKWPRINRLNKTKNKTKTLRIKAAFTTNRISETIVSTLATLRNDHSAATTHSPPDYACNYPSDNEKGSEVHDESTKPHTVTIWLVTAIEAAEVQAKTGPNCRNDAEEFLEAVVLWRLALTICFHNCLGNNVTINGSNISGDNLVSHMWIG